MTPMKPLNILMFMVSATLVLGCSPHKVSGFIEQTTMAIVVQVYVEQEEVKVDVVGLPDRAGIVDGPFQELVVPTQLQPIDIGDRVTIEILYHIDQSGSQEPSRGELFTARIIQKNEEP